MSSEYDIHAHEEPRVGSDELVRVKKTGTGELGKISLVVTGGSEKAEDHQEYGRYVAQWLIDQVERARAEGKTPVLDLATGNTPKAAWPFIAEAIRVGHFSPNGIVFTGHEVVYGEPEESIDYEGYRLRKLSEVFGIDAQPITDVNQVTGEQISGNFISMYLIPVLEQTENFFLDEQQAAEKSAQTYSEILHALAARADVEIISLYGVGKDGHIAEIQPNTLTLGRYPTSETYAYSPDENTYPNGVFPWNGDKASNVNLMPVTDKEKGYQGAKQLLGWGWEDLLLPKKLAIAFDSASKEFAFTLAMEGSVNGTITQDGTEVMDLHRNAGEGEGIFEDLVTYAEGLVSQIGLDIDRIQTSKDNRDCRLLFQLIYKKLLDSEANVDDPQFRKIFEKMWEFSNRYVGKQAPVSVLIRLRTLLGLDTTIIVNPQVVETNEKYQVLLGNRTRD